MKRLAFGATVTMAAMSLASMAAAHITANPNTGAAGAHLVTHFIVAHGCSGSPTVALRIKLPAGLREVKPEAKPGWIVEIRRAPIAAGAAHDGHAVGPVSEVVWRGGALPDSEFATFGLLMELPKQAGTLYFPAVQECEKGRVDYVHIPAAGQRWHDVKDPAPFVEVTGGQPPGHGH